jgi:GT2 family glycosyltransferase
VWLLNSDTEVGESSLEQLYVYINTHNDVGVVGPQLVYADQRLQSVGGFFPTVMNVFLYLFPIHNGLPLRVRKNFKTIACAPQQIPPEGLPLDYVTGAALLVRKQALDNVGGLGEEYFMYFEETDLCWRLHMHGWKIKVISTQPVVHIYGGSYKHARDKKRLGMFLQSLKIFIKKNYTGWKKNSMLAEIFLGGHFSIFLKTLR